MKRGRPIKYTSDKERKEAIKESKTRYMSNKQWYCDVCLREYLLAGKWTHMHTKKHIYNHIIMALKADDDINLVFGD